MSSNRPPFGPRRVRRLPPKRPYGRGVPRHIGKPLTWSTLQVNGFFAPACNGPCCENRPAQAWMRSGPFVEEGRKVGRRKDGPDGRKGVGGGDGGGDEGAVRADVVEGEHVAAGDGGRGGGLALDGGSSTRRTPSDTSFRSNPPNRPKSIWASRPRKFRRPSPSASERPSTAGSRRRTAAACPFLSPRPPRRSATSSTSIRSIPPARSWKGSGSTRTSSPVSSPTARSSAPPPASARAPSPPASPF